MKAWAQPTADSGRSGCSALAGKGGGAGDPHGLLREEHCTWPSRLSPDLGLVRTLVGGECVRLRLQGGGGGGSSASLSSAPPRSPSSLGAGRGPEGFSKAAGHAFPGSTRSVNSVRESEPSWGLRGGSEGCLGPDLRVWVTPLHDPRQDGRKAHQGWYHRHLQHVPSPAPTRQRRANCSNGREKSCSARRLLDPAGTPRDALRCSLARPGSGFTLGVLTGSRQGLGRLVQQGGRKAVVAVLLWDRVGTRVGGPRAGTLPHLPMLTQQPIGGRSWTKHARGRWLG